MHEKIQTLKTHVRENKRVYLASGVSLVIGAGAATLAGLTRVDFVQIVDAFKVQINSPTVNEITTVLARRGHPGFIVKCLETGVTYASQNHAAAQNGISPTHLSQHLNGVRDAVKGLHFFRIAEAV